MSYVNEGIEKCVEMLWKPLLCSAILVNVYHLIWEGNRCGVQSAC